MPVDRIRTFACEDYIDSTLEGTPLCEFSIPNGEHAWYDESTQHIDKSAFPWESAVYKKKIRAECRLALSMLVDLNNGRSCSFDS